MAGDWIKMRGNLWDDPRVARLCDLTDTSEGPIIGALYWLWATADQHSEDGIMPGLTLRQIDRKTGVQGFGAALCTIGWLVDQPEGVLIVRFEEHNGQSAKRRCVDAQRKANGRNLSALDADATRTDSGQKAPNLGAREREEKREEDSSSPSSKKRARAQAPAADLVSPDSLTAVGFDPKTAADFIAHKTAKKAPLTARAWADHQREAAKAGWSPMAAAEKVMARNWAGFEAKYVAAEPRPGTGPPAQTFRERDADLAAQRVAEMTGGLVSAKPQGQRQGAIDGHVTEVGREAVFPPGDSLRLALDEPVGRH